MNEAILDAVVSLRRNYADLPFQTTADPEAAHRVNGRVMSAMERSGDTYTYLAVNGLESAQREELLRLRLISDELQEHPDAVIYLHSDRLLCVEAAGEDHFTVTARDEAGDAAAALRRCRTVTEQLSDTGPIARDGQLGYLTARPCDAGTGLRASLLLHLPLTLLLRRLPAAMKTAAEQGILLRGAGNGVCLPENRVAMGAEAEALIERLTQTAEQLAAAEEQLCEQIRAKHDMAVEDKIWRAYATARYARLLGRGETLQLWSMLSLGRKLLTDLPYDQNILEELRRLARVSDGELADNGSIRPDAARAERIRSILTGGE